MIYIYIYIHIATCTDFSYLATPPLLHAKVVCRSDSTSEGPLSKRGHFCVVDSRKS